MNPEEAIHLVAWAVFAASALMYPLGFLFGACSPCCQERGCCRGTPGGVPTQAVVTISGITDNGVDGYYESCRLGTVDLSLPEAISSAATFSWSSCSLLNTTHVVDIVQESSSSSQQSTTIGCGVTMKPYQTGVRTSGGFFRSIRAAELESLMTARYGSLTMPRQTSVQTTVLSSCVNGSLTISVSMQYAEPESVFGWPCRMPTSVRALRFAAFGQGPSNPLDDSCEAIASRKLIYSSDQPYFRRWPCTQDRWSPSLGCPFPNPEYDPSCIPDTSVFYYEASTYCQRNFFTDATYSPLQQDEGCLNSNPFADVFHLQTYDSDKFIFENLRGIAFATVTEPFGSFPAGEYKYIPAFFQTIIGGRAQQSHQWAFTGCLSGQATGGGVIQAGQTQGVENEFGNTVYVNGGGLLPHGEFDLSHALRLTWFMGEQNRFLDTRGGYQEFTGGSVTNPVTTIYDLKLGCDVSQAVVSVELQA